MRNSQIMDFISFCNRRLMVLLIAALFGMPVHAEELTIEITQGSDKAIAIAVVPFKNNSVSAIPEDVSRIVKDDLQRSGEFDSLAVERMLSLPTQATEVYFRDWKLLGQSYLVVGEIEYSTLDKKYKVRYEVFDVNTERRLIGEVLSGSESSLRDLAHRISDTVYKKITGVRGIFSTRIAYVTLQRGSKGETDYRLQIADADGRRSRVLLKTTEPVLSPAWSPKADKIAYVSFETGRPAVYVQTIATGARQKVSSFKGLNGAPAWSPDGSSLALTLSKDGNAEIYLMDMQTSVLKKLTNHFAIDTEPSWSPNGKDIVFTSDRSGSPQVYRMSLSDLRPTRLTFDGRYNARPRFSDDGKRIFYVHQKGGVYNIAALDLKDGSQRILTETPLDESPSIAPNGRMLIYGTQRGKNGVLAVVSVDGQAKYFLPSKFGDVREPAWSPFLN